MIEDPAQTHGRDDAATSSSWERWAGESDEPDERTWLRSSTPRRRSAVSHGRSRSVSGIGTSVDRALTRLRVIDRGVSLRWWAFAGLGALVLAVSTAGLVEYTADHGAAGGGRIAAIPASYAAGSAQDAAARWIVASVGSGQVVACDVQECAVLHALGMPAASLVTVRAGISDLEQADAVVSTPLLRQSFGADLDALVATEPLAVFGSGRGIVQIDAVALDGPADYGRRLAADRAERRTAGAALLTNPRLTLSPTARGELAAGQVDNRVCALLALLSGSGPLSVAGFAPPGPGAGADVPWPGVVVSAFGGKATAGSATVAGELRAIADSQQSPYRPVSITAVVNLEGRAPQSGAARPAAGTVEILFAEPGPLDLLAGGAG